jgi:hypothetical protein
MHYTSCAAQLAQSLERNTSNVFERLQAVSNLFLTMPGNAHCWFMATAFKNSALLTGIIDLG